MGDTKSDVKDTKPCRECGNRVEAGVICPDCESRVDSLIRLFAKLNGQNP